MKPTRFNIIARGEISVYKVVNAKKTHILTRSNQVLPEANFLIMRMMAQESEAQPYKIEAFLGNTKVIEAVFQDGDITRDEGELSITYNGTFPLGYIGNIDQIKLSPNDSDTLGSYTQSDASISVASGETLIITWKILFSLTT